MPNDPLSSTLFYPDQSTKGAFRRRWDIHRYKPPPACNRLFPSFALRTKTIVSFPHTGSLPRSISDAHLEPAYHSTLQVPNIESFVVPRSFSRTSHKTTSSANVTVNLLQGRPLPSLLLPFTNLVDGTLGDGFVRTLLDSIRDHSLVNNTYLNNNSAAVHGCVSSSSSIISRRPSDNCTVRTTESPLDSLSHTL